MRLTRVSYYDWMLHLWRLRIGWHGPGWYGSLWSGGWGFSYAPNEVWGREARITLLGLSFIWWKKEKADGTLSH